MNSRERPKGDYSRAWADLPPGDIGETLLARAAAKRAGPAHTVNMTENGDIINLGPMPPEALAEFLAARRRK